MNKKILGIVFFSLIILLLWNSICFADAVIVDPMEEMMPTILGVLGFVSICGILVTFSLNLLKTPNETNNEEKHKKIINKFMWFFLILFIYDILGYLIFCEKIREEFIFIPITLSLLSIILKFIKRRVISNILLFLTMVSIIVLPIISMNIENNIIEYNEKFEKYIQIEYDVRYRTERSIEKRLSELIAEVKDNNQHGRKKVSITYNGKKYTTPSELEELKKIVDFKNTYDVFYEYHNDYLDNITIKFTTNSIMLDFEKDMTKNVKGKTIKKLLSDIRKSIAENKDNKYRKDSVLTINWDFEDTDGERKKGQVTITNDINNYDEDIKELQDLIEDIKTYRFIINKYRPSIDDPQNWWITFICRY